MNLKIKITILMVGLINQGLFAQFTGTNPAELIGNGDAMIGGDYYAGPHLGNPFTNPAKLNLMRFYSGVPSPTDNFYDYTTGIRMLHLQTTPGNFTGYDWGIGVRDKGLQFYYENLTEITMTLDTQRQVGIGTSEPNATLHVKNFNSIGLDAHLEGFTLLDGNQASLLLGAQTSSSYGEWGIEYNTGAGGLNFWKPYGATTGYGNYYLFIKNNGKVSIGLDPTAATTFNGDYQLYVNKGILTEKVKVALKNTADWADYVFDDDYPLMPLKEVEQFVKEHHHLPGVPSAEEVKEQGIDVATMDAKLLEKIEELTLHIIELERKYDDLKKELEATKK